MAVQSRRLSRVELVAEHLKQRGHISEGSAFVEYGRFRLGDAIYRLRRERRDLLPENMEIITINKQDTQGQSYGEYHLVPTAASAARAQVQSAQERGREMVARLRTHLDAPHNIRAYEYGGSLLGSLGPQGD